MEFLGCFGERFHTRLPDEPPSWCPKETPGITRTALPEYAPCNEMAYITVALAKEKYGDLKGEKLDPLVTIRAAASFAQATHNQNGAVGQCQSHLQDHDFDQKLNRNTAIVVFDDGHLWDSETPTFRPITPDDCVSKTVKIPHTVVRDASCEEVAAARAAVASLFDEDDKTDYVLMALAGSLFEMSYEEFCLLHSYGTNGKSTLVSLVKAAFGDYFVTLKAETLTNSSITGEIATPFLMSIKGARFVNTTEPKWARRSLPRRCTCSRSTRRSQRAATTP